MRGRRGLPASAGIGMALFHVRFDQWLDDPAGRELVEVVREGFERLKAVTSGAPG